MQYDKNITIGPAKFAPYLTFMHQTAILLINLGSPEGPETKFLKPYLTEFLMDERVIDVPGWLRTILVKGLIVPFRASKSAEKYKRIWTPEGSPLVAHTKKQRNLLQDRTEFPVYYSMRYGSPSAEEILKKIHTENPLLKELIVFPLYPHYAMSSYETAVEQINEVHGLNGFKSQLNTIPPFYRHSTYIEALSKSIAPYLTEPFDHILFSYHGIPERHVKKTDCTGNHCLQSPDCCEVASPAHAHCYRHHIITTTKLVAERLGLEEEKFSFSFQSRLGRDAWLKPFTIEQLRTFPSKNINNLLIACPAFVSDCLETLEEIQMEGKEEFLKAGGRTLTMIPALNENVEWIDCMQDLIMHEASTQSIKKL